MNTTTEAPAPPAEIYIVGNPHMGCDAWQWPEVVQMPLELAPGQPEPTAPVRYVLAPAPPLVGSGEGEGDNVPASEGRPAYIEREAADLIAAIFAEVNPSEQYQALTSLLAEHMAVAAGNVQYLVAELKKEVERTEYFKMQHAYVSERVGKLEHLIPENAELRHRLGEAEAAGAAAEERARAAEYKRGIERVRADRGLALATENQATIAALRAKLATEGEQEAQLLKRDEELRGLRADVQDMNRQIGEAHAVTGKWIAECGKRTEGRKAAEKKLHDFQLLVAQTLSSYLVDPEKCFTDTGKDWAAENNRLFNNLIRQFGLQYADAAAPIQGEEARPQPWCARCPATEADVNAPGFRCAMCESEGIFPSEV